MRALLVMAIAACCATEARADFNECLGLEMSSLAGRSSCEELLQTCQEGVYKLNQKLDNYGEDSLNPVSIISASESKTMDTNSTKIAMLVQLAPLTECVRESTTEKEECKFDMPKVEFYSILLTQEPSLDWKLEGYQRHSLSEEERSQIVEEYNSGKFYGSKVAVGIFDAPDLPSESDSQESPSRPVAAVFAASVSGLFCLGLVLHHRKRLQNGYAPILITKGGHVQRNKSPKRAPEKQSLRPADAAGENQGASAKKPANERFAV